MTVLADNVIKPSINTVVNKTTTVTPLTFTLHKGNRYPLCNALLTYLKQSYQKESEFIHGAFNAPTTIFKQPKYTKITQKEGVLIDMQHLAYNKSLMEGYAGWVKTIERYAKRLNQITFYRTQVDINNDGIKDSIQTEKYSSKKLTIFANYPLTPYGTLAVNWYENYKPSSISGEIFIYQGRTFTIGAISKTGGIRVNEPSASSRLLPNGLPRLFIRKEVCIINY